MPDGKAQSWFHRLSKKSNGCYGSDDGVDCEERNCQPVFGLLEDMPVYNIIAVYISGSKILRTVD